MINNEITTVERRVGDKASPETQGEILVNQADGFINDIESGIRDNLGARPRDVASLRDIALGEIAESAIGEGDPSASMAVEAAVVAVVEEDLGKRISGNTSPLLTIEATPGGPDAVTAAIVKLHEHRVEIAGHDAGVVAALAVDELAKSHDLGGSFEIIDKANPTTVSEYDLGDPDVVGKDKPHNIEEHLINPFMGIGINTETGNFDCALLPRSQDDRLNSIHDKSRRGEPLNIGEAMEAGRDTIITTLGDIHMRTDAVYRATGIEEVKNHISTGRIGSNRGEGDEYRESDDGKNDNMGIDWYLGGVARRYGNFVIEVPARPDYFQPAFDNGTRLAKGAAARHMKSSGYNKPVPIDMANVIFKDYDGIYLRMPMRDFASRLE